MLSEEETHKVIKTLMQHIEYLEDNYPDNPNLDMLKLLLLDTVSEDSEIHIKSSLQNKEVHLYFSNYADYIDRFEKENLYN